jgi:hypothetical protein
MSSLQESSGLRGADRVGPVASVDIWSEAACMERLASAP